MHLEIYYVKNINITHIPGYKYINLYGYNPKNRLKQQENTYLKRH